MSCIERITYLEQLKANDDLEPLRLQAINDIEQTLNHPAHIAHSNEEYYVAGVFIPRDVRIVQYNYKIYTRIYRPEARGHYHHSSGKIILHKGKWCRKTVIHETLHSVSILSNEEYIEEGNQIRSLKEALTEFLTGLILFRKYRNPCFNNWKTGKWNQWCNVSYKSYAQTLCALSSFVSAQEFVDLYLWRPDDSWANRWNSFSCAIKNVCPRFEDNYETWKHFDFMIEFRTELTKKLDKKFRKMRNLFNYNFVRP